MRLGYITCFTYFGLQIALTYYYIFKKIMLFYSGLLSEV